MRRQPPDGAIEQSFGAAQQQAAAMAGPPPPWQRARSHRGAARWVGLAVASLAAGGVAGWLGMRSVDGPAAASPAPPPNADARLGTLPARAASSPAPAPALVTPATPVTPTAADNPPSLDVTRQAGLIRIKASKASLAEVMRALAQVTHTTVRGAEALLSIPTPITLDWQGSDPAAAWNLLLGRFANTAVSCSSTACELWVVGLTAPPRAAGGALPPGQTTTPNDAPPPPAALPLSPAAPANGEENTETN